MTSEQQNLWIALRCKQAKGISLQGRGVLDQVFDIEVSKRYPFLIPIFPRCIADIIPIFKNTYMTLYQFSETAYPIPIAKIAKVDTVIPKS